MCNRIFVNSLCMCRKIEFTGYIGVEKFGSFGGDCLQTGPLLDKIVIKRFIL